MALIHNMYSLRMIMANTKTVNDQINTLITEKVLYIASDIILWVWSTPARIVKNDNQKHSTN